MEHLWNNTGEEKAEVFGENPVSVPTFLA